MNECDSSLALFFVFSIVERRRTVRRLEFGEIAKQKTKKWFIIVIYQHILTNVL